MQANLDLLYGSTRVGLHETIRELLDDCMRTAAVFRRNRDRLAGVSPAAAAAVPELAPDPVAAVCHRDVYGRTMLHLAAAVGHPDLVRILCEV
jgi:ankyrin repeat protein